MDIDDLQRLRFKDGDCVVVTVPDDTTPEMMTKIADAVHRQLPGRKDVGGGLYTQPDITVLVTPYTIRVVRDAGEAARTFCREERTELL